MSEESSVDINFTHDRNYYVINLIFLVFLEFHARITAPGDVHSDSIVIVACCLI